MSTFGCLWPAPAGCGVVGVRRSRTPVLCSLWLPGGWQRQHVPAARLARRQPMAPQRQSERSRRRRKQRAAKSWRCRGAGNGFGKGKKNLKTRWIWARIFIFSPSRLGLCAGSLASRRVLEGRSCRLASGCEQRRMSGPRASGERSCHRHGPCSRWRGRTRGPAWGPAWGGQGAAPGLSHGWPQHLCLAGMQGAGDAASLCTPGGQNTRGLSIRLSIQPGTACPVTEFNDARRLVSLSRCSLQTAGSQRCRCLSPDKGFPLPSILCPM